MVQISTRVNGLHVLVSHDEEMADSSIKISGEKDENFLFINLSEKHLESLLNLMDAAIELDKGIIEND